MDDMKVYYGGAVKALGDGRVGGMGITWGSRDEKDADGEYFHDKTYLGAHAGDGVDTLFHHTMALKGLSKELNDELSNYLFPAAKASRNENGVFFEVKLDLENNLEKLMYDAAVKNKLGFSTGAPAHAIKLAQGGRIDRWIISELSFTPKPADARNRVVALKSLQEDEETCDYTNLFTVTDTPNPAVKTDEPELFTETVSIEDGVKTRSVIDTLNDMPLSPYLLEMRGVLREFKRRCDWIEQSAVSTKSGRTLSSANLSTLSEIHAGMKDTHLDMMDHIDALAKMIERHNKNVVASSDVQLPKIPTNNVAREFSRYLAISANSNGATVTL